MKELLSGNNTQKEENINDIENINVEVENLKVENNENVSGKNEDFEATGKVKKDIEPKLTLDKLALDYNSIELNWKSSRKNCTCFEPLDSSCAKLNCSRCGEISCESCAENGKFVQNQVIVSSKHVFTCQSCLKNFSID